MWVRVKHMFREILSVRPAASANLNKCGIHSLNIHRVSNLRDPTHKNSHAAEVVYV